MQDGATPHTAKLTRDFLEINFHLEWSVDSRTLNVKVIVQTNPCDYFLWGFLKDSIYGGNQVDNITRLKENIEKCFKELPTNVIKSPISNIHCRVTKCINKEGKNFE